VLRKDERLTFGGALRLRRFPVLQRSIVAALREAREKAGFSQRALSLKLGEPSNLIQRIEALERDISAAEFVHICKVMGADPVDVLRNATRR
jgi:ribosome-binding protein aMBF1 (putative translation factor)